MPKPAFYALVAVVGLASGAADAAIATFHCDAAPIETCHYVVYDQGKTLRVNPVQGGQSMTVDHLDRDATYCRAVDGEPDDASCNRQPVPLDADFHDRVRDPGHEESMQ